MTIGSRLRVVANRLVRMPRAQWDITRQDVRFAIRKLLRQPLFTLVIVGSLALGIGANATTFGFASTLLLQSIAPDPDGRIVGIGRGRGDGEPSSWPDYVDYRERNHVFSHLAAYAVMPVGLGGGRRSDYVMAEAVTGEYFAALDIHPFIGRLPAMGACTARCPLDVVLSHDLWMRRYQADRAVIGQQVLVGGVPATIIGIAPAAFRGSLVPVSIDLWMPLASTDALGPQPFPNRRTDRWLDQWTDRQARWLGLIGRLKAGVTPEQATADLNTIDRQLQREYRYREGEDRRLTAGLLRGVALPHIRARIRQILTLLTGLAVLVLLISCANVANMTMARGTARRPEIGIRHALGASNARLVRQLLTESILLSLAGGVAGGLVAYWLASLLQRVQPPGSELYTYRIHVDTDVRVWIVTFGLSLTSGMLFGLLPAWRAARGDAVRSIRGLDEEGRPRLWAAKALVVAQIALSLVLLVVSGLFLRSLREVQSIQPGFQVSNGIVVPLPLDLASYAGNEDKGRRFYRAVQERVSALPGVRATSLTSSLPLSASDATTMVMRDRAAATPTRTGIAIVDAAYFEVMNVPLLGGRTLSAVDTAEAPRTAVIDESLARQLWPDAKGFADAVGSTLRIGDERTPVQVVGVVGASLGRTPVAPARPLLYMPVAQHYSPALTLIIRTASTPDTLLEPIRAEIERVDETVPLRRLRTLETHVEDALWLWRIGSRIVSGVGLLALALAVAGMYGVMAWSVARRTREIGIRMALGARPSDVLRTVVGQGTRLTIGGAAIGVPLALAINTALSRALYGIRPIEPAIALAVAGLWLIVTVMACGVPAMRAVRRGPIAIRE